MIASELAQFARKTLESLLHEPGVLLNSAADTLKRGDLYLLGLNPRHGAKTLAAHLDILPNRTRNSYLDGSLKRGASLRNRVYWLVEQLGFDLRSVCASNLIFTASRSASDCGYPARADTCWPVHLRILEIVQPRCILVFGNAGISPYRYLREQFLRPDERKIRQCRFPSGHGTWKCRAFPHNMHDRKVWIIGLPHLSRYDVIDKTSVITWISGLLNSSAELPK